MPSLLVQKAFLATACSENLESSRDLPVYTICYLHLSVFKGAALHKALKVHIDDKVEFNFKLATWRHTLTPGGPWPWQYNRKLPAGICILAFTTRHDWQENVHNSWFELWPS